MAPDAEGAGRSSRSSDEQEQRVGHEQVLDRWRERVYGVEHCRHVHDELREHRPQVLHVAEEDVECGEDEPEAYVEQRQRDDRVDQQQEVPGEADAVQHAEDEEDDEENGRDIKKIFELAKPCFEDFKEFLKSFTIS